MHAPTPSHDGGCAPDAWPPGVPAFAAFYDPPGLWPPASLARWAAAKARHPG